MTPKTRTSSAGSRIDHARTTRLAAVAACAIALTAGSSVAWGQFYRGGPANYGGNLLTRNLSIGGGGGGLTRDQLGRSSLNFRNSIIYGNAGGGLSFQGSIPYTAPEEFRGQLQTDALYAFRRDSFYSSVATSGVRTGDSLAYRRALSTGGSRPLGVDGSLSVARTGTPRSFNPTSIASPGVSTLGPSLSSMSLGRYGNPLRRSASGSSTAQGTLSDLKASALKSATGATTRSGLYSQDDSSLTGDNLRSRITNYVPDLNGPDQGSQRTLDGAEAARQRTERIGAAGNQAQGPESAAPQSAGTDRVGNGLTPASNAAKNDHTNTTYDELRDRIKGLLPATLNEGASTPGAQGAQGPQGTQSSALSPAMRDFQRGLADLTSDLRAESARVRIGATARSRVTQGLVPADTTDTTPGVVTRPFERIELGPDGKPIPSDERLGPTIDPKTLKIIRSAGTQVDTLIPGGAARRDIYGENMAAGQQALAEGRFFDAEDRFARAGSMRRGDTTPSVGVLHSQIGSGLVMSAGRSLRILLTDHPEMTAMRYAANLRPGEERTSQVVGHLRDNIAAKGRMRRDSSLLLAYIGYQAGNKAMIAEGLDALAQTDVEEQAADPTAPSDTKLIELLRGVWLAPDEPASENAPAANGDGAAPATKPDPSSK